MTTLRRALSATLPLALLPLAARCSSGGGASPSPAPPDAAPLDAGVDAAPPPECLPGAHDDVPPPTIHTPRWAFEPWLSKDLSNADDTRGFVQGSLDRGIPVGVAVLDSPWESDYNTYVPSDALYPAFDTLVADLAAKNVKLVVWTTQFTNSISFDLENGANTHYDPPAAGHDLAAACGFFVDEGTEYEWYKGKGGALDFFDPSAVAWWHRREDAILSRGIAGFKVDFGDNYVPSDPVATAAGPKSHQAYSEKMYEDFYAYAQAKRGRDFVTMVRGWDESYQFAGRTYARPEHAPVVWAGDNRRDWIGVADALNTTFMSASLGYVVLGSDVGGYLDRDDKNVLGSQVIPFDTLVFDRWVAFGALSPLMQLHTRANVMPWTVPDHVDETVALYKYWASLHHALVPFFYSLAEETYAKRAKGIVVPVGDQASWAGDFRYMLGDALLVAPLLDATGVRDVPLPAGARYYDWFAPAADAAPGGATLARYDATDRAKIPLFVREGAIVPLEVSTDAVAGLGTSASAGHLTVLVYPAATASRFALHEADDSTTVIAASAAPHAIIVSLDRALRPTLLRIRTDTAATGVTADGAPLARAADFASLAASASGWLADASTRSVWVAIPASGAGSTVNVVLP